MFSHYYFLTMYYYYYHHQFCRFTFKITEKDLHNVKQILSKNSEEASEKLGMLDIK